MPQHELLPTSGRRACHASLCGQSRRAHLNFSCSVVLLFCAISARAQHSLIRACAALRSPAFRTDFGDSKKIHIFNLLNPYWSPCPCDCYLIIPTPRVTCLLPFASFATA